ILNSKINFGKGINDWMHGKENEARTQISFLLSRRTPTDLVLNIICIALFAGISEELIFRGVVQRLVIQGTKSPWIGILVAAFLFSFIHFQFFGFIPRFLLGILLGAIYWYSGSLWPAIAAHFIYDAFLIVLAYFNPQMVSNADTPMIDTSYLWVGALMSAVILGGLLWWMKRNSTNSYERVYASKHVAPSENDFTF
ncbi:MAG TPA: CPBP family intramembrane glutamic endopeptidase, partial [Flavisolibacter sp.]|nr:CPBP family intramembrane glutamic endopeptidase [Flavisolibacter sp.]